MPQPGWQTENNVGNKEDCASNIVLVANEPKVAIHALNLCIPDISSIDMGKQIEDCHYRD